MRSNVGSQICLPVKDQRPRSNYSMITVGWAVSFDTEEGQTMGSNYLVSVRVDHVDDESCRKGLEKFKTKQPKGSLCARPVDKTVASDQMAEGAPLFQVKGRGVLVGVLAFKRHLHNGTGDILAVFTKVANHIGWISKHTHGMKRVNSLGLSRK